MSNSSPETEQSPVHRGMWMVLAAAVLWGTTGTAQALAPATAQPISIGFVRLSLGTVALAVIAAHHGHLGAIKQWRSWPRRTTLLASVAIAAYQLFFFAALDRTGVAVGTIVGIGSTPIAAGVFAFIAYRTLPGRKWVFATLLALLGCALLILSGGDLRVNAAGILLAIAAGSSYALYTLLGKKLLASQPRGAVLALTFFIGTILLSPVLLLVDLEWLADPRGMLVALHLGIVTVGVAYQLYAAGLNLIPVTTTATLTLAEPLTAGLLGVFLLGEDLSSQALIGVLLLLAGLVLLVWHPAAIRLRLSDKRVT